MRTTWLNYFEQHPNQTLVMAASGAVIGYVASESYMGALAGAAVSVANSRTCNPREAIFAPLVSAALKRAGEIYIWDNPYISLASLPVAFLWTRWWTGSGGLIAYCAASSLAVSFVPSIIDAIIRYKLPLIGMGMVGAEIFCSANLGGAISSLILVSNTSEFNRLFITIPVWSVLTGLSGMGSYSVYFSNSSFHLGTVSFIATAASIINLRMRFFQRSENEFNIFQGLRQELPDLQRRAREQYRAIQTLERENRDLEQRLRRTEGNRFRVVRLPNPLDSSDDDSSLEAPLTSAPQISRPQGFFRPQHLQENEFRQVDQQLRTTQQELRAAQQDLLEILSTGQVLVGEARGLFPSGSAPSSQARLNPADEIPQWIHEDLVFKEFECPINKAPIVDPVLDPTDGVTLYERTAIEYYLRIESKSPTTRRPLRKEDLIELPKLKALLKHRADFYKREMGEKGKTLPDPKLVEEARKELLTVGRAPQAAPGQVAEANPEVIRKFEKFLPNR